MLAFKEIMHRKMPTATAQIASMMFEIWSEFYWLLTSSSTTIACHHHHSSSPLTGPQLPVWHLLSNLKPAVRVTLLKWKPLNTYTHSSIIHNSQGVKTTNYPLMDEWVNKVWYIHKMEYYSFLKRRDFCCNLQYEWKRHTVWSTYIRYLEQEIHKDK